MEALVELEDQAKRSLRDEPVRMLHVVTTAALRGSVLDVLRGLEAGPHAPGPVVVLEAEHATADPGWAARGEVLRRHYEARRARASEAGEAWPALGPPPAARGLASFAEQLGQVVAATPEPHGWVVVLAPAYVKAAPQWSRAIAMLRCGSALGRVRWMVVDVEQSSLVDAVAPEAELRRVECKPDDDAIASGLGAGLAAPRVGAPGARVAGVTAPPRPGQPPPPVDDPEAPQRRELARLLLGASEAQRAGRGASAVEQQRKARDLCEATGWTEAALQMELVLGGYLLAAGAGEQAVRSGERAVEAARGQPRAELLPLAQLSLGSTLVAHGDRPAAMIAYANAATSAEQAGATALMLEACRLTADTAVLLGMEAQAIAFWSRAVKLAEAEPLQGALGSAGHCARAMALLCKRRRLHEPEQRYWDAARRFDGIDEEAVRTAIAAEAVVAAPVTAVEAPVTGVEPSVTGVEPSVTGGEPSVTGGEPSVTGSEPSVTGGEPSVTVMPPSAPSEPPAFVPFARSTPTAPFTGPVAEGPSLVAIEEGTADLSLADLAAIHWQGMIPSNDPSSATPPTIIHEWTPAEQEAIRRATSAVMSEDSTSMLTREEVFALHGQAALPPARAASPSGTALIERATAIAMLRAADPEAEGTAWLAADELASIRARFFRAAPSDDVPAPAPAPAPPSAPVPAARFVPEAARGAGDTTSMLSPERLAELARAHAKRVKGEPED